MQAPSRKWIATQITAVAAWAVAFVEAGYEFTDTLVITAIGIASQAALGYFLPNETGNPESSDSSQAGYGLVELVIAVLVILILVVLLLRLV